MPCLDGDLSQRALEAGWAKTTRGLLSETRARAYPVRRGRGENATMAADKWLKPGRRRPREAGRPLMVSIRLAVSALVLAAILLTAAISSLVWWETAEAISQQLASTINEQIVAAVR